MSDEQGDEQFTANGFAKAEEISTQSVISAIKRGVIAAERTAEGYYLFQRESVPSDWLEGVKMRRDIRWGGPRGERGSKKGPSPRGANGRQRRGSLRLVPPPSAPAPMPENRADALAFLRGQLTAKDEVIDRLLRLLEAR